MATKQGPGQGDGETAQRIAEVEADVERLFERYIKADAAVRDEGFELEAGFGDGGHVIGTAETGQFTFVRWRWRGHHTGEVGRFDGETFDRSKPEFFMARGTGNAVTVEGLTILEERADGIYPRRFVDWLSVYSQMGIIAPARPIGRASTELRDPPDARTLKPPVDPRDVLDDGRPPAKTAASE